MEFRQTSHRARVLVFSLIGLAVFLEPAAGLCQSGGPTCDDGDCEVGETVATCPADCLSDLPCSLDVECEALEAPQCTVVYCEPTLLVCALTPVEDCECEPDCEGQQCGHDGCDGTCGVCPAGTRCEDAQCVSTLCTANEQCSAGQVCQAGACTYVCGNGLCEPGETTASCVADCSGGAGCLDASSCPPDADPCTIEFCDWAVRTCGTMPMAGCGCTPQCFARVCGGDGCGGVCGACAEGQVCDSYGQCQGVCVPYCEGRACGSDNCGGSCGSCPAGSSCDETFHCAGTCEPSCAGRQCGIDGCGVICGICPVGQYCGATWQCGDCTPFCANRECGPDGCGGLCGACGAGLLCGALGTCVSTGCTENSQCSIGHVCQAGQCVTICPNGTCDPGETSTSCPIDCVGGESCLTSLVCPSDGNPCTEDACNLSAGVCQSMPIPGCVCTTQCADKACGADGCGGTCGVCAAGQVCDGNFQCAEGCVPACAGNACGPDGCGALCGTCAGGQVCNAGQCTSVPACAGKVCGPDGSGGSCGSCGLTRTCGADGLCSNDCTPTCEGKTCGADGCGGWCGSCPAAQYCNVNGQCGADCEPYCAGRQCGGDGCGGSCGACGLGQYCTTNATCVPWSCTDTSECAVGQVCQAGVCAVRCGNGVCDPGETSVTCPMDCPSGLPCTSDADCPSDGVPCTAEVCSTATATCRSIDLPGCTCTPDCANKQCGPDNCGGTCGDCGAGRTCGLDHQCQGECTPNCLGRACGSDNCGGSCGACANGEVCSTTFQCCAPQCEGLTCGPDLCGGSCGECELGQGCFQEQTSCFDFCLPDCAGRSCGPNGCGGLCGLCAPGHACGADWQCAPATCTSNAQCVDGQVCQAGVCAYVCGNAECEPGETTASCSADCPAGPGCISDADCPGDWNPCTTDHCDQQSGICESTPIPGCTCTPACGVAYCGPDGCGGICGACAGGLTCNIWGQCVCTSDAQCDAASTCVGGRCVRWCSASEGFACDHDGVGVPISCWLDSQCPAGSFCDGTCKTEGCGDDACIPGETALNCPDDCLFPASCAVDADCPRHDAFLCVDVTCDLPAGLCTYENKNFDSPCGYYCAPGGRCAQGSCIGMVAICDDWNPCTIDLCDLASGQCSHTPYSGDALRNLGGSILEIPCNAEDRCDLCLVGECGSARRDCDDGSDCTVDECDGLVGCLNEQGGCDDGNACTEDACAPGGEVCAYDDVSCDDNDPCTNEGCEPLFGCSTPVADCQDWVIKGCTGHPLEEDGLGCEGFFLDQDSDGYGVGDVTKCLCGPRVEDSFTGMVAGDCDDANADVYPGAPEVCNGWDDDCDGLVDADDPGLVPDLPGRPCENQQGVCFGASPLISTCVAGAWEPCGVEDYRAHSPYFTPWRETLCDGLDNDCDGATDEDFLLITADGARVSAVGAACGEGACAGGTVRCNASMRGLECSTAGAASTEACADAVDNDCDGVTDAGVNGCGGCELLSPDPGSVCTTGGQSGVWTCSGVDAVTCLSLGSSASVEATIHGTVLDARSKLPLQGVDVAVREDDGQVSAFATVPTNAKGSFHLPVARRGVLTVDLFKAGYIASVRSVSVFSANGTCEPVLLVPVDGKSNRVAEADLEPGALFEASSSDGLVSVVVDKSDLRQGEDIDIRLNWFETDDELPGPLPPTSAWTYAVNLQVAGHETRYDFAGPVTVRFRNTLGFPSGTRIPIGVWNPATARWEDIAYYDELPPLEDSACPYCAKVVGEWIEFQIDHFTSLDINFPGEGGGGGPGGPGSSNSSGGGNTNGNRRAGNDRRTASSSPFGEDDTGCSGDPSGSYVGRSNGSLRIELALPAVTVGNEPREVSFLYDSVAAFPTAYLSARDVLEFAEPDSPECSGFLCRSWDNLNGITWLFEGQHAKRFYEGKPGPNNYAHLFRGVDGAGAWLPTGSYPYWMIIRNYYEGLYGLASYFGGPTLAETQVIMRTPEERNQALFGYIDLVNERRSPFGAGWTVANQFRARAGSDSASLFFTRNHNTFRPRSDAGILRRITKQYSYYDESPAGSYGQAIDAAISNPVFLSADPSGGVLLREKTIIRNIDQTGTISAAYGCCPYDNDPTDDCHDEQPICEPVPNLPNQDDLHWLGPDGPHTYANEANLYSTSSSKFPVAKSVIGNTYSAQYFYSHTNEYGQAVKKSIIRKIDSSGILEEIAGGFFTDLGCHDGQGGIYIKNIQAVGAGIGAVLDIEVITDSGVDYVFFLPSSSRDGSANACSSIYMIVPDYNYMGWPAGSLYEMRISYDSMHVTGGAVNGQGEPLEIICDDITLRDFELHFHDDIPSVIAELTTSNCGDMIVRFTPSFTGMPWDQTPNRESISSVELLASGEADPDENMVWYFNPYMRGMAVSQDGSVFFAAATSATGGAEGFVLKYDSESKRVIPLVGGGESPLIGTSTAAEYQANDVRFGGSDSIGDIAYSDIGNTLYIVPEAAEIWALKVGSARPDVETVAVGSDPVSGSFGLQIKGENGEAYRFDTAGRQIQVVDDSGVILEERVYNAASGLLEKVVFNPGEATYYFTYTGSGTLSRVMDPSGKETIFEVDPSTNRLTAVAMPDGAVHNFRYDAYSDGNTEFDVEAEASGPTNLLTERWVSRGATAGEHVQYLYDRFGMVDSVHYPDGTSTQYERGRSELISAEDGRGSARENPIEHKPDSALVDRVTDAGGHRVETRTDQWGRLVSMEELVPVVEDAAGGGETVREVRRVVGIERDDAGRMTRICVDECDASEATPCVNDCSVEEQVFGYDDDVLVSVDEKIQGNLVSHRDFEYVEDDEQDLLKRVSGTGLGTISLAYDEDRRLVGLYEGDYYAGGASARRLAAWTYETSSRVASFTNAAGETTSYTAFDDLGNVRLAELPDGSKVEYVRPSSSVGAGGVSLTGSGRIDEIKVSYSPGTWISLGKLTYDPLGRVLTYADGTNPARVWAFAYDSLSPGIGSCDACSGCADSPTSVVDPLGNEFRYAKDFAGRLRTAGCWEVDPSDPENPSRLAYMDYAYDLAGRLASTGHLYEAPVETYLALARDEIGRVTQVGDARGVIETVRYDAFDKPTRSTMADDGDFRYVYDEESRLHGISASETEGSAYAHDADGYLREHCMVSRQDVSALESFECAGSGSPTWSVDRDDGGFGRLESYTDPHGRSLVVGRDADSMRVRSLAWADALSGDTLAESFDYDTRGRLNRAVSGDVSYQYAYREGRLARKDLSIGPWSVGCDYVYDPSGLLAYAVGPTFASGTRRLSMAYTPDVAARLWMLSVRSESLSIDGSCPAAAGVDLEGDPDVWCVDHERTFLFSRDALGRVTRIDHPNGVVSEYSYFPDDPRARLDSLRAFTSSGLALVDLDYSYHPLDSALLTGISDLDAARRIVDSGGSIPQDRQPGWAYDYDPLDRLASASFVEVVSQGATLAPSSPALSSYTYDTVGRRTLASFAGAGALEEKAGTYTWDDLGRLSSVGAGTSFAYDASGRMTSFVTDGVTHSFEYDPRGRVQSLVRTLPNAPPEPPSTDAYAFKYGFDHRIVELTKPSGSTVRFFDDGLATYELAPDGELTSATIWQPDGFSPLASVRIVSGEAAFFYFHNNHLSAPIVVTDDNENAVWAASYSPFGLVDEADDPDADGVAFDQPIRLPGQLDLFGGDVSFNWHRFYLPSLGLYATLDPDQWGLGSSYLGLERYSYASNAPTLDIDPTGRRPWGPLGGLYSAYPDQINDIAIKITEKITGSVAGLDARLKSDPLFVQQVIFDIVTGQAAFRALAALRSLAVARGPAVLRKACGSASRGTGAADDAADAVRKWLGDDARAITNKSGDKVFINNAETRRVRFDINNPNPHQSPHSHVEELLNGEWQKSGPIYPTDVIPR